MTDQAQTATASSGQQQGQHGIFLPSLTWTADRQEAELARDQLQTSRVQLALLLSLARKCYEQATWWLMADAALSQLDRDIDDLFEWLEAAERQKYSAGVAPAGS
jgi:hypothetical protein